MEQDEPKCLIVNETRCDKEVIEEDAGRYFYKPFSNHYQDIDSIGKQSETFSATYSAH